MKKTKWAIWKKSFTWLGSLDEEEQFELVSSIEELSYYHPRFDLALSFAGEWEGFWSLCHDIVGGPIADATI